jgi:hypothetical protein
MAGATDVDELVAAVSRAETQRDENWAQVLRLQAELLEAQGGRPRVEADAVLWRQRATDLAAVLAKLIGDRWDHPVFDVVQRRARRASLDGHLLDDSVLDELDRHGIRLKQDRPSAPAPAPPTPVPEQLSRAERRRLEREERRRRP